MFDPAHFLSGTELAWQPALKKIKVKVNLLTYIDMLLVVKKKVQEGICHAIHRYAKANNKYIKQCDKNKESLYLNYWDVKSLCGW